MIVTSLENALVDYYHNYHECNLVHPKWLIFVRSCEKYGRRKHCSRRDIIWIGQFLFQYRINEETNETLQSFHLMWLVGYYASQAAVLLMTIERSIVITKPLIWNEILPRKRILLFMLCSWIAVVT